MADSYTNFQNGANGNAIFYNQGRGASPNFNFMLRVELLFDLPCRKVHSFTKQNEFENIQEGGLNDYVHMRRKPISQPFTFQVERYVGVDYIDPLGLGTDLVAPLVLMVWRLQMMGNFTPFRIYTFTGCTVTAKEYGELNAEQSGLLVETTTIAYRELLTVTTPDNILDGKWVDYDFKKKDGTANKTNKYARTPSKDANLSSYLSKVKEGTYTETGFNTKKYKYGNDTTKTSITRPTKDKNTKTYITNVKNIMVTKDSSGNTLEQTDLQKETKFNHKRFTMSKTQIRPITAVKWPDKDKASASARGKESAQSFSVGTATFKQGETVTLSPTFAKTQPNDSTHPTQVLWQAMDGDPQRGRRPETDKDRADSVLWKDVSGGEALRATIPRNDDRRAQKVLWTPMDDKPQRGRIPEQNSTHAQQVLWKSMDGEPQRGRIPEQDSARAEQVLWPGVAAGATPQNTRARKVDYLK